MKFASVCSGIDAPSVAWNPLGWSAQWFSEIEKFPCAVLAHHYPDVPNLGDMLNLFNNEVFRNAAFDLLVGGTPCQSFSVAGGRGGLDDPRGQLMLAYLDILAEKRPRWMVWENVPGVLSSNGGRDFGAFLGGLGKCGYGWSYRVLDAQYFGVPQRRRRVFVVGHLGDWRPAAAVLFERESLQRHPAPRRETGQGVAALTANGVGASGADDNQGQAGHLISCDENGISGTVSSKWHKGTGGPAGDEHYNLVAGTLNSNNKAAGSATSQDAESGLLVPVAIRTANTSANGHGIAEDVAHTLDGAQGPAVAFDTTQITSPDNHSNPKPGQPCHTLSAGAHAPAVAMFKDGQGSKAGGIGYSETSSPTLTANKGGSNRAPSVMIDTAVRRLTPRECERLQELPDDYTLIPGYSKPRGKDLAAMAAYCGFDSVEEYVAYCPPADGPRYKAIGNSIAIPPLLWIGERIDRVDVLVRKQDKAA